MKRLIYLLVPLALLGALIVWRLGVKKTEAAAQTSQRESRKNAAPAVSVATAEVHDIVRTFESIGNVEAPFNVKIAPKLTGLIQFLQVHEGDRVTRGQILVRIDPSQVASAVRQQQAALAEAESRLTQAQLTQNPTNVAITTQISQQQAVLASAQADYNQVRQNYASQRAAAAAAVTDAQGRINSALAGIGNAEAAIRSARANLGNARAKYDRANTLFKEGAGTAQEADDTRTMVDVQQGALDVAQGQLNAAKALRDSAAAQKQSAQQQANIVTTKGRADIEAAREKVNEARAALLTAKANTAQKPAYQQNLAALKGAVAAAKAGLGGALNQRADTVLKSPLNGFVTARYMDPGSLATPGQPILVIQDFRQVWATVPMPEEIGQKVHIGQTARVAFDALPGRAFAGKIIQINPSADPLSRQFTVRILLDNGRNLIKPGMFARVSIVTERVPAAIVVPREAVQQTKAGPAVVVVSAANVAQRRPVTLGASDTDKIAIARGVRAGENVVTVSAFPLKDGQVVRPGGGAHKLAGGTRP